MANEQQVKSALKAISDEHWRMHGAPILLSNLPPMLEAEASGYKDGLAGRSLKEFIKGVGPEAGFKLIEHPTQRAKLAVAPIAAEYEFPKDETRRKPESDGNSAKNQESVLAFLQALSTLPPDELDKVVIPISTLIKLLK